MTIFPDWYIDMISSWHFYAGMGVMVLGDLVLILIRGKL